MSHPTLDKLAKSREKLLAAVSALPEETLDLHSADGWTIRETLTHLVNSEEDHCRVIAAVVRGEAHRLPSNFDLNQHNAARLAERGHLTRAELFKALDTQRQRTVALFNSLGEDQMALVGTHPALGETTVSNVFRVLAMHEQMHTRDIQAVLKDAGLA
jgi:uncharacterized damage-inducible protein DinB